MYQFSSRLKTEGHSNKRVIEIRGGGGGMENIGLVLFLEFFCTSPVVQSMNLPS